MPKDNGFVPNQDYSWLGTKIKQEDISNSTFHIQQMEKVIDMYDAMNNDFDDTFKAWCNDEVCQKVVEQLHKDQDNRLIPENNNVYQTLIEAYNRAYNANLTIGK